MTIFAGFVFLMWLLSDDKDRKETWEPIHPEYMDLSDEES